MTKIYLIFVRLRALAFLFVCLHPTINTLAATCPSGQYLVRGIIVQVTTGRMVLTSLQLRFHHTAKTTAHLNQ